MSDSDQRTSNPAYPRITDLICAKCNAEYPISFPLTTPGLTGRELGDGSVCLTCEKCDSDLGVFAAW